MDKLIVSPTVFTIGKMEIDWGGLHDWAEYNGFYGYDSETPVGALLDDIEDAGANLLVEFAGRHCYRSWSTGRDRPGFIHNILEVDHGSVLEHATLTFAIQGVSRTLSHELVRHRVGVAISQESQRYVDAQDIKFVVPPLLLHIAGGLRMPTHEMLVKFKLDCTRDVEDYTDFKNEMREALAMKAQDRQTISIKRINEAARSRLPNASETRLTWTANIRTLRHFLQMRGSDHADLEIRRLACHIHDEVTQKAPLFFADFKQESGDYGVNRIFRLGA